jgi:DNA gyrase subunit B
MTKAAKPGTGYDASSIQNLAPRDHVRLRPSSYVGGTGSSALVHLVDELLANAADEALAGHAKTVWLTIAKASPPRRSRPRRGVS